MKGVGGEKKSRGPLLMGKTWACLNADKKRRIGRKEADDSERGLLI